MFILWILLGIVIGFGLYHWILGSAGFFGKVAHNAVERRLTKITNKALGKEHKPDRGFGLRKRN